MSDDAPTEADQDILEDLNSIFNNVPFWAYDSSEEAEELKQRLKEDVQRGLQEAGESDSAKIVKYQLGQKTLKEKYCRDDILAQVRKSVNIPALKGTLRQFTKDLGPTLTEQWLSAWLRVKNAIPKCILDAVRQSNNDLKLADPTHPRRSVLNLLAKIRGKNANGFRGLEYASNIACKTATGHAHYIGKANFRHGGNIGMVPKQVLINAPIRQGYLHDDRVHVYHEESGSGKTVELAASAFTRDALFTIMLDTDDVELLDSWNDDEVKDDRMNKSWTKLTSEVKSVLTADETSLDRLVNFLKVLDGKMQEKTTLFIVVGIDEASKSTNFVRAIIENHNSFGWVLGQFIQYKCTEEVTKQAQGPSPGASQGSRDTGIGYLSFRQSNRKLENLRQLRRPGFLKHIGIKVLFSVAGTGASQGPAGSDSNNFEHFEISARSNPADVYDILRREYAKDSKGSIIPEYTELEQFPLLKAIVDSNARMISIYMAVSKTLQTYNQDKRKKSNEDAYEQNFILSRTFTVFMNSNGMKPLLGNPYLARLTASQALAVLLFQQNEDFSKSLTNDQLNNMDYGLTFQRFKGDLGGSIMRRLVVKYGLVTARPLRGEENSTPQARPFALSDAMQLLCLWLIQGGEAIAAEKSFLGTTSASFETLTALLAGAAIAASSVVKKDKHGRVVAAPANGPNPNTVGQQEADIFAALGKVGMTVAKTTAGAEASYKCETIIGTTATGEVEIGRGKVNKHVGKTFWALKDAHLANLEEHLGTSGVYFHKSMMTCAMTKIDRKRIRDAAKGTSGAAFHKVEVAYIDDKGHLQYVPITKNLNKLSRHLKAKRAMLIDTDLLLSLAKLRNIVTNQTINHSHEPTQKKRKATGRSREPTRKKRRAIDHSHAPTQKKRRAKTSTDTHTDDRAKKIFNMPLIGVGDGSSELADAYVTFLAEWQVGEPSKKTCGLRSICIQAKDYAKDTSPNMATYMKNAKAVRNNMLDKLFSKKRVYCIAGAHRKVAWGYDGEYQYIPFAVTKSVILKNRMEAMDLRRSQTAKHAQHASVYLPDENAM